MSMILFLAFKSLFPKFICSKLLAKFISLNNKMKKFLLLQNVEMLYVFTFQCPSAPSCCESGQYTLDECGCCQKCAKAELQKCGGASDVLGRCAGGLQCLKTCSKTKVGHGFFRKEKYTESNMQPTI